MDDMRETQPPLETIGRRALLKAGIAGLGTAGLAGPAAASASADRQRSAPSAPLTAQTTEGPYYIDVGLVRADLTEGLAGIPLDVVFTVLDPFGHPLPATRVDIWHCDARGRYSGFARQGDDDADMQGKTFLRGTQKTDAGGSVTFRTLYPGWYRGRTTHIHFKVISGDRTNLTSQFFLPDALSEFLYTQLPDYRRTALRDTLNSIDGIAIAAGETVKGAVHEIKGAYAASLIIRIDPTANPPIDRPPRPGEMPHGGFGPPPPGFGPTPGTTGGPPGGPGGHGVPPGSFFSRAPLEGEARAQAILPRT